MYISEFSSAQRGFLDCQLHVPTASLSTPRLCLHLDRDPHCIPDEVRLSKDVTHVRASILHIMDCFFISTLTGSELFGQSLGYRAWRPNVRGASAESEQRFRESSPLHEQSRELFCFSKPYSRGFVAVPFVTRRLRKTTLEAKSLVR